MRRNSLEVGVTNDAHVSNTAAAVSRNYSVNRLNQYSGAGQSTFGYDLNGNLDSDSGPDGSTSFVYDAENRLVSGSGTRTASLVYDPLGRLFSVTGPSSATQFLYDGDALVAEYDTAGNLLRRYVHGSNAAADDPLIWYEGANGTPRGLFGDHQGSIVAVADVTGAPIATAAYDAWGIPNAGTVGTEPGRVGRFGYTGQAWIPELGMWHYKARIYSPTLGRFLQTDPVGYEGGINLYGYAQNDPVSRVDPNGQTDISFINQYDPPAQREIRERFDMPGTTTILAHGGANADGRGSHIGERLTHANQSRADNAARWRYPSPQALAAAVNQHQATQRMSQPVALFACRAGLGYAQQLSQALGGRPVIATAGWVTSSRDPVTGTMNIGAVDAAGNPTRYNVYGGSWSSYGFNVPSGSEVRGFTYNDRTGYFAVRISGTPIGSIIPRESTHVLRPGK